MAGQQTPEARAQRAAQLGADEKGDLRTIDERSHMVILRDNLSQIHESLSSAEHEVNGLHRDLYNREPEEEMTSIAAVEAEKKTWLMDELIESTLRAISRIEKLRSHASTTRLKLTGADNG